MKTWIVTLLVMLQITLSAEVYDCFTFFNELELLTLRFEELYDSVDHFVLVESKISFTGKEKPLHFAENAHRFEKYKDKIIHIVVEDFSELVGEWEQDHWTREKQSRNAFLQGLKECKDSDIIFISDLDEIPRAAVIPEIKDYLGKFEKIKGAKHKKKITDAQRICTLNMRLFMYQMNRENFSGWLGGSKATSYAIVKKYTPWGIKLFHHTSTGHIIENAGWHFNTMGGKEKALEKWVFTGPLYNNDAYFEELATQDHLLEQSYQGQVKSNTVVVPIDNTFPKYFLEHLDHWRSIGWIADK